MQPFQETIVRDIRSTPQGNNYNVVNIIQGKWPDKFKKPVSWREKWRWGQTQHVKSD